MNDEKSDGYNHIEVYGDGIEVCPVCGSVEYLVLVDTETDDERMAQRDKWHCDDCGQLFWGEWYRP